MKKLLFLYIIIFICSCSNDTDEIYDTVLSNTKWYQEYIENEGEKPGDVVYLPPYYHEMFAKLQPAEISKKEITDTIWNLIKNNTLLLSFKNNTCNLKETHNYKGTYKIRTRTIKETYYPNQTVSGVFGYEFVEMTVFNDSIIYKYTYKNITYTQKLFLGKDNKTQETLDTPIISEEYAYSKNTEKKYNMTYIRNNSNIEFHGDKNLTGFINDNYDELYISELGTFYKKQ